MGAADGQAKGECRVSQTDERYDGEGQEEVPAEDSSVSDWPEALWEKHLPEEVDSRA